MGGYWFLIVSGSNWANSYPVKQFWEKFYTICDVLEYKKP